MATSTVPKRPRQRYRVVQEAAIELGDRFHWKALR